MQSRIGIIEQAVNEATVTPSQQSWFAKLPRPIAAPLNMYVADLKALMDDLNLLPGRDFIVVDVRRTDMDVSSPQQSVQSTADQPTQEPDSVMHPCAINLPAQSFYQTLPTVYQVLKG